MHRAPDDLQAGLECERTPKSVRTSRGRRTHDESKTAFVCDRDRRRGEEEPPDQIRKARKEMYSGGEWKVNPRRCFAGRKWNMGVAETNPATKSSATSAGLPVSPILSNFDLQTAGQQGWCGSGGKPFLTRGLPANTPPHTRLSTVWTDGFWQPHRQPAGCGSLVRSMRTCPGVWDGTGKEVWESHPMQSNFRRHVPCGMSIGKAIRMDNNRTMNRSLTVRRTFDQHSLPPTPRERQPDRCE